jgi:hypothetical protein
MVSLDPYQDPNSQSGSGSRRAKMTHKNIKKINKFLFLKCWMFSLLGLKASPVAWTSIIEA